MKREHSRWRARALADLVRVQATSGAGVKFANPLKGGKIECYYKGVTSITGPPSGDLEKSVEDEHRKLATCDEEFSTDETKLLQEIHQGLSKLEQRIDALETIVISKERNQKHSEL